MKPIEDQSPQDPTRRTFLQRFTAGFIGMGAAMASWPMVRALVPNVLYEPPKRFRIGRPDAFLNGITFLEEHRIFLMRDGNRYAVVSGVCSHLGCTVKFAPFSQEREITVRNYTFKETGEFRCPCHGSRFHGDGTNYAGPAPRPLQWHHLEISPNDGSLVVDLSVEVERDFRLVV